MKLAEMTPFYYFFLINDLHFLVVVVWLQSVEQLPPICQWFIVSNQIEFEQVVSVQAFSWRLLCWSLPASGVNIGKQYL